VEAASDADRALTSAAEAGATRRRGWRSTHGGWSGGPGWTAN